MISPGYGQRKRFVAVHMDSCIRISLSVCESRSRRLGRVRGVARLAGRIPAGERVVFPPAPKRVAEGTRRDAVTKADAGKALGLLDE